MPVVRTCSLCGLAKQRIDRKTMTPEPDVVRYGLFRQIRKSNGNTIRQGGFGGIDLCTECWEKVGKPNKRNTRPVIETRRTA